MAQLGVQKRAWSNIADRFSLLEATDQHMHLLWFYYLWLKTSKIFCEQSGCLSSNLCNKSFHYIDSANFTIWRGNSENFQRLTEDLGGDSAVSLQ